MKNVVRGFSGMLGNRSTFKRFEHDRTRPSWQHLKSGSKKNRNIGDLARSTRLDGGQVVAALGAFPPVDDQPLVETHLSQGMLDALLAKIDSLLIGRPSRP
jgi:hypothetical protein